MRTQAEVTRVQALKSSGFNHSQISVMTGIPRRTVVDWLQGKSPTRRSECWVCVERHSFDPEAYTSLLGLYLGDGYIAVHARGVSRLRIACCNQYPDLMDLCEIAMASVLPNKVSKVECEGCTEVCSYSKHWPCLFPQHGAGKKHDRRIELEHWQIELVERNPWPLILGLIHSDGCRALNKIGGKYEYPRYQFSNRSHDIHGIFQWACDLAGLEWRVSNRVTTSISRRAPVAAIDAHGGAKS